MPSGIKWPFKQTAGSKAYYDPVDQLSRDQVEEIEASFKLFDKNGDGTIVSEEVSSVMRSLGMEPHPDELKRMIEEFDIDGNGTIDYDEFLKMMARKIVDRERAKYHTKLHRAFSVFDQDQNGYITEDDLKVLFHKLMQVELTDEEIKDMIELADLDGDGKINFEEFVRITTTDENGVPVSPTADDKESPVQNNNQRTSFELEYRPNEHPHL